MYALDYLKKTAQRFNPQIDYVGQNLCLKLVHSIFIITIPFSLFISIWVSDIRVFFFAMLVVLLLTSAVVIPGWPMYRRNPVQFKGKIKPKEE